MSNAWFEYKGVNSLDMNLQIVNDISFPSPEADVEFIEVLGRDGELAISHDRLKGVPFSIPVKLKAPQNKDVNTIATKISEWLKTEVGWYPLKFSGSTDYEYIAICYERFDILENLKQYGRTVINFRLKPYKRRIDNQIIELSNGDTLTNPENRESKPLIIIEGSGDITFQNNGVDWLILKGVDDLIVVDTEMMSVYKDDRAESNKMISTLKPMFPILTPGDNEITWTGNITKIEIHPRWEVIS